jgi:hypothetical protein
LFTVEELALYNGTDESLPILLGILGWVLSLFLSFFKSFALLHSNVFYSIHSDLCLMSQKENLIMAQEGVTIIFLEGISQTIAIAIAIIYISRCILTSFIIFSFNQTFFNQLLLGKYGYGDLEIRGIWGRSCVLE